MNLVYFILIQASLFAIGASLVAFFVLLSKRPPRWWAYLFSKLSLGGIIGILMVLVFPTRTIPGNPITWLYIVLVLLGCIGMIGVAYDVIKRFAREV